MNYEANAVAEAAGITYRQMDHWTRQGYIDDSEKTPKYTLTPRGYVGTPAPKGSGYWRSYSEVERQITIIMADLIRSGFKVENAASYARNFVATGLDSVKFDSQWPSGIRIHLVIEKSLE